MRRVEPDEFQAWKELTLTQWVLGRLKEASDQLRAQQQAVLLNLSQQTPDKWASLQPEAAYVKGFTDAAEQLVGLTLEDLQDEEAPTE